MKSSLAPIALGVVASISIPLQVSANDSIPPDLEPVSTSAQPDPTESTPVVETSSTTSEQDEPTRSAEMPVSKEVVSAYTESSGALNFEPTPFRATAASVSQPEPKPVAAASSPDALPEPTIATRSNDSAPDQSSKPDEASVKRDFGGAHLSKANPNDLFEGGSESLVARTVGAAEGTRTPNGGKTQNYHGHVDPGNGVWNRGTFSYQFGNSENLSPDEADRRQLAKIKRIYESIMLAKAEKHGVAPLTLEEEINGIDLINQAPLAVTEDGGYIERLAEAKQKGLTGTEAILKARIWAFWDDGKGGWDAPGLRAYDDIGKEESIRRDQDRRIGMISQAIEAYEKENGTIARRASESKKVAMNSPTVDSQSQRNTIADAIIFGEKPATRG